MANNQQGQQEQQKFDHIYLKPSQALEAVITCARAGEPFYMEGDPGIGKTAIAGQAACRLYGKPGDPAEKGLDTEYFRKYILSQREPIDALGLPYIDSEGITRFAWPADLPREGSGMFFMDEMPQAVAMVQAPARQLLTEKRFGPHALPEGWIVGAAGNYPHNRAGAQKLLTHVGSSIIHLHIVPDLEDFLAWAVRSGVNPKVQAFLRFKSQLLHQFTTEADTFPCPRTWAKLSNIVDAEPHPAIEQALYAGTVGEGAAVEYVSFVKVFQHLPDIDMILRAPDKVQVPKNDNVGTLYALASELGARADDKNFSNVLKYCKKMPKEFAMFTTRDAVRRDKMLAKNRDYVDWTIANQDYVLNEEDYKKMKNG